MKNVFYAFFVVIILVMACKQESQTKNDNDSVINENETSDVDVYVNPEPVSVGRINEEVTVKTGVDFIRGMSVYSGTKKLATNYLPYSWLGDFDAIEPGFSVMYLPTQPLFHDEEESVICDFPQKIVKLFPDETQEDFYSFSSTKEDCWPFGSYKWIEKEGSSYYYSVSLLQDTAVDSFGNVYFISNFHSKIYKFTSAGEMTVFKDNMWGINSILVDKEDNLIVALSPWYKTENYVSILVEQAKIVSISSVGNSQTIFTFPEDTNYANIYFSTVDSEHDIPLAQIIAMTADSFENIYILNNADGKVFKIHPDKTSELFYEGLVGYTGLVFNKYNNYLYVIKSAVVSIADENYGDLLEAPVIEAVNTNDVTEPRTLFYTLPDSIDYNTSLMSGTVLPGMPVSLYLQLEFDKNANLYITNSVIPDIIALNIEYDIPQCNFQTECTAYADTVCVSDSESPTGGHCKIDCSVDATACKTFEVCQACDLKDGGSTSCCFDPTETPDEDTDDDVLTDEDIVLTDTLIPDDDVVEVESDTLLSDEDALFLF